LLLCRRHDAWQSVARFLLSNFDEPLYKADFTENLLTEEAKSDNSINTSILKGDQVNE